MEQPTKEISGQRIKRQKIRAAQSESLRAAALVAFG
jgi:hypothetical protein